MKQDLDPVTPTGYHRAAGGALEQDIPEGSAPVNMPTIAVNDIPVLAAGSVPPGWSRRGTTQEIAWATAQAAP